MAGDKRAKHLRITVSLALILVMIISSFCFAYAEAAVNGSGEGNTESADVTSNIAGTGAEDGAIANDGAEEPSQESNGALNGASATEIESVNESAPNYNDMDATNDVNEIGLKDAKTAAADDVLALIEKVSLPVIVIHIDESEGHTINDMNEDRDHNTECYGTLDIIVPDGFKGYVDMDITPQTMRGIKLDYIRGRGNSTWTMAKKPYKIKLAKPEEGEEPVNMMGLGTNKHWVLLANTMDPTQIRNRITYKVGEELGFGFNPKIVPVDVIMKSNTDSSHDAYLGTYYLAETIRVDEDRLDIGELKKKMTDPQDITGGYLLKGGEQTSEKSPDYFVTEHGVILANDTPSFDPDEGYINDAQKDYIRNHIKYFEDVLYSEDLKGEDGVRYNELMDMKTAANYWLIQQITGNGDAYTTGSTYLYKVKDTFDSSGNRTATGKLFWGPLWDFDIAYGENDENIDDWSYFHPWLNVMLYDKAENGFRETVKKEWPKVRDDLLAMTKDGGLIDQYRDELMVSHCQDFDLWKDKVDYYYNKIDESYTNEQNYKQRIEFLKAWIRNRVAAMDEFITSGSIDNCVHKITFMADGKIDHLDYLPYGRSIEMYIPDRYTHVYKPEKEGYLFLGWEREDGTLVTEEESAQSDTVYTARFIREDEAKLADEIAFRFDEEWCNINDGFFMSNYTVLPPEAQDKTIKWSSSDESIAVVNEEGGVTPKAAGTVMITATLKSGVERSYELTIVDGPQPRLESAEMEPVEMVLKVGEYRKLNVTVKPKLAKLGYFMFLSDDSEIATVDYNTGVVTGVKPGTTWVRMETAGAFDSVKMAKMEAEGSDGEGADDSAVRDEPPGFIKECKVTVIETDSDDEQDDGSPDDDEVAPDNKNADGSGPDKGGSPSPGKKKGAVKTGDDSKLMLWSALFLAALAESVIILIRRKRSGN